ncbi:MAG: hypothetical protein WC829_09945 [Hyphomicrobium sp.]|jgi:hypothetical protein
MTTPLTPLPEPDEYMWDPDGTWDTCQKRGPSTNTGPAPGWKVDPIYTKAQLKAYGAAEYQRGLEDAAKVAELWGPSRPIATKTPNLTITGRWEGEQAASVNIAAAIRKLGES